MSIIIHAFGLLGSLSARFHFLTSVNSLQKVTPDALFTLFGTFSGFFAVNLILIIIVVYVVVNLTSILVVVDFVLFRPLNHRR